MKDFLLFFLVTVAILELVALGVINYKKTPGVVLAVTTQESGNNTRTPIASEEPQTASVDYLSALELVTPSATQVASLSLTPNPVLPTPLKTSTKTPSSTPTPAIIPTQTPTGTPLASPTVSALITPSPTPTATPTVQVRVNYSSQEINGYIDRFAGQYGVDANVIRHIALCESGFRAGAVYLSYGGLFQFSSSTWTVWRRRMGEDENSELRFNAEEAVQTAAYVISKNSIGIWPNCKP